MNREMIKVCDHSSIDSNVLIGIVISNAFIIISFAIKK